MVSRRLTLVYVGRLCVVQSLFACTALASDPEPPPSPTVLHQVEPLYSPEARAAGEHGDVVVMVAVDESGDVTSATIAHLEQPWVPRRIESAAIAAALASRFAPPKRNGVPIFSGIHLVFKFRPKIRVAAIASPTEVAVGDSVLVRAEITSDVRLDSVEVTVSFPADPYGGLMNSGLTYRHSFHASLPLGKPVPVTARFAAEACGSDSIGVECMAAGHPETMTRRSLPLCIRGYPGSHLPEYRSPPPDSMRQAFRVDSKVQKQKADPCCSAPIPGAGD